MSISCSIAAFLITKGVAVPAVIGVSLAVATLAGLWNGLLVGYFRVSPIVATLILMVSGRGVAQLLTGGQIITFHNAAFEFMSRGNFLGLPFTITLTLLVLAILRLLKRRTA